MFSTKINCILSFILFLFIAFSLGSCSEKIKASLIVHNGVIYTVDSSFSNVEAMAIENGKIIALGSNKDILNNYQSDSIIDAKGKSIFPGLIDAHCHFTGYATDKWKCELYGTKSFEEVIKKIQSYASNAPMEWIYGHGWDQNDWPLKIFPNKNILDSLFPNRPVFLKRIDGHAALVNQKALDIAGVNSKTIITGGSVEIINGKLTGMLIDNAMSLVDNKIPTISDSLALQYYTEAQEECFAFGLTGVHDCGINEHTVELLMQSEKLEKLKMKVFALLSDSADYYARWISKGPYKSTLLHVGGFKLYADGALGSRGACLLENYSDKADWKGFLLDKEAHFNQIAKLLVSTPFQMCTHAIGDSGNRIILKIYANALKGKNDKRWRIEHAQVMNSADFHFFGDNNVIPSVQPTHATSDMYWAGDRLGSSRIKEAYAYKKLLQENNWMPLGTDFPVEYIDPFKTFYASIVRKDATGFPKNGFQVENALSREQTIRGMTIWAAKAAFEEKEKGSLEIGKSADFIILDKDLMKCKESEILTIKIVQTFINGKSVFKIK